LTECLSALMRGIEVASGACVCEVCVLDDAHEEGLAVFLKEKFPQVLYTKGPGKGPSANRNHGARQLKGEWIIFIDDDCIPSEGLLKAYEEAIALHPEVQAFEGKIHADRPQMRLDEQCPLNLTGGSFWSCNVAIDREAFERVGGFDEDFPYAAYEDMDLQVRLKVQGIDPQFVPEASVCHPWRIGAGAWRRFFEQRRSSLIYLKKHPEVASNFHPWMLLKITIGRLLYSTLPGLWKYRGRGFLSALAFDMLELGFVVYRWVTMNFKIFK
jgi:GT2 family glycosyltransferase